MAITDAIMQMRRGLEADFDPDKMRPGEWAVSTDKKYVRMCFSQGVCVRMATYDAFEADMAQIEEILSKCETIEEAVSKINTEVSTNAQAVAEYTEQAKKYRDEAKKFRDEAESITGIGIATKDKAGIVKPDGTTITVDEDGTIHSAGGGGTTGTTNYADLENKPKINGVELSGNKTLADLKITTADSKDNTVTFSQADTREKILSNEKHSTLFGKIAKWLSDLKTVAFSGSYSDLINKPSSLDTYEEIMANTESGKFAGALGVQEGFETLTNSLGTKINCLNPNMEMFLGTWAMNITANASTDDGGKLHQAILNATGWSGILLILPIMSCTIPVSITWYGNIIYAHNASGHTFEQLTITYVAFGNK